MSEPQIKQKAHTTKNEAKTKNKKSQIMKKLATTFGLLALMLIVTSFTTPEIGGKNTDTGLGGNRLAIGGKNTDTGLGGNRLSIGGKNTDTGLGGYGLSIGGKNTDTGLGGNGLSIGGKNTGTDL